MNVFTTVPVNNQKEWQRATKPLIKLDFDQGCRSDRAFFKRNASFPGFALEKGRTVNNKGTCLQDCFRA